MRETKRAALLGLTRRVTLLFIVGLPISVVVLLMLWAAGSAGWSPSLFVIAGLGILIVGVVTAELWRRLDALSDLSALNEQLRYRATHDLLMNVPNREQLHVELADALEAGQTRGSVGLAFLDLDRFKFVNDSMGHAAGDELLKAVGRRVERAVAVENAVLARVGGDELVVLMRDLKSRAHLDLIVNRVLAKFDDPFAIDGVELQIGTSVGLAIAEPGETADQLYRYADAALYEAKERGRNQAVFADAELRAKRDARVRTELALREALDGAGIEAWFQPEIDLATGEIVAAEALARWRTAEGVHLACTFIDVARRAGLLEQLMGVISNQLCHWRRVSGATLPLALNISAAHLATFLAQCEADPDECPLTGLRLEIAETDIIDDFAGTRDSLSRARELGAKIMLDDFGAGYSSLQMLSDLPIDGIKIDRSFIARMETDPRVHSLVTSIADFARSSDIMVVAEGVETVAQVDLLSRIGIDRGQGFLFSGAVAPAEFEKMLGTGEMTAKLTSQF